MVSNHREEKSKKCTSTLCQHCVYSSYWKLSGEWIWQFVRSYNLSTFLAEPLCSPFSGIFLWFAKFNFSFIYDPHYPSQNLDGPKDGHRNSWENPVDEEIYVSGC
jgi:hypothetical protein